MQSFRPDAQPAPPPHLPDQGWKPPGKQHPALFVLLTSILLAGLQPLALGQIVPDRTLPNRSIQQRNGRIHEITGGTTRNRNLFHSFERFSVPPGNTAFFNNATKIENIFARVTGRSISNIDGLIRANGSANLFLLNPNGITFGPNARLNLGGSFISSTADSIQFADGSEFSAVAPRSSPLLTISTPVGLQYGTNPGPIHVDGNGHNLRLDQESLFILRDDRPTGLQVQQGQTLALLGGDISLKGANLTAAEGRIELGSLGPGNRIRLSPNQAGWQINYPEATDFGKIRLSQAASVDVSGEQGGRIQVEGQQVVLTGGSTLLANTFGNGSGGNIQIRSAESVTLQGSAGNTLTDVFPFPSSVLTEVRPGATGSGGNLRIETAQLQVLNGTQISASTYGAGPSGNLQINAQQIELAGEANDNPSGLFVTVNDVSVGNPGDLTVKTDRLIVRDGAQISSSTFAPGDAGNLDITAQSIQILGRGAQVPSGLFAATFGAGNGGQLTVNADRLEIADGSEISANTFAAGNAGNVRIHARAVTLIGLPDFATGIFAQVQTEATGRGGNLEIQSEQLRVLDGAAVSASTFGAGKSGNLTVRAQEIELAGFFELRRSGLFTSALIGSGRGGDLLVSTDRLVVRDGAMIGASNFHSIRQDIPPGQGAAGNVEVSASSIRLDNEGIITASTREGGQGNIAIAPGLQLLASQSLAQEERRVLIGGLTEPRQGFAALPSVAVESHEIANQLISKIFLNQSFTTDNLQKQVQNTSFPLVHLATHGQFSSNIADTFILTWNDRLTIEGLRKILQPRQEPGQNPIELLVLSACETAVGDQYATLGLAGLAVRSGTRSTLATLWSVNDNSTTQLMVNFYQALNQPGASKAKALRQAQIALLKDPLYQHPFYWAAFILAGNWV